MKARSFISKTVFVRRRRPPTKFPAREFDQLLLDHAAENGAEVRQETAVKRIEFFTDSVELQVEGKAATRGKESARAM